MRHRLATSSRAVIALVVVTVLTLLFWKFRIYDASTSPALTLESGDMFLSHYPMISYAFGAIREGRLPLWNPYQLCGQPLLAIPYVAALYPLHVLYVLFDVGTAVELLTILHMILAGAGMWTLMRHWGLGTIAALCSAVTFMWSGMLIDNNLMPTIFGTLSWAPLTVYLVDRVLLGRAASAIGLAAAVGCQLLLGAMEVFIHTAYLCALLAMFRLAATARNEGFRCACARAATVSVGLVAGVALASIQLFPTIELTRLSSRAVGSMSIEQATFMGVLAPAELLQKALEMTGWVSAGALPVMALGLALGAERHRSLAIFAVTTATFAALLVVGGGFFELYFRWFPTGNLFRRPIKFLDMYCFAQAVLVGLAIGRLDGWVDYDRRRIWKHPAWIAALGTGAVAVTWLAANDSINGYLIACVALLATFGLVERPAWRTAIVVALCVVQGTSLFLRQTKPQTKRLVQQPEFISPEKSLMKAMAPRLKEGRLYVSPDWFYLPELTPKQGILNRIAMVVDYEPLTVGRYVKFFSYAAALKSTDKVFDGSYVLRRETRWRLMDLTSARIFIMHRGEPGDLFMDSKRLGRNAFRMIRETYALRVFERIGVPPRAHLAWRARVLESPDEVLTSLDDPLFDSRAEVILEPASTTRDEAHSTIGTGHDAQGTATITVDEPERVVVDVDATQRGFLVLNDLFYPGWRASIGSNPVPIRHANYLFRAVEVPAGRSQVTFEYGR